MFVFTAGESSMRTSGPGGIDAVRLFYCSMPEKPARSPLIPLITHIKRMNLPEDATRAA
jgi:hypothetical protein